MTDTVKYENAVFVEWRVGVLLSNQVLTYPPCSKASCALCNTCIFSESIFPGDTGDTGSVSQGH